MTSAPVTPPQAFPPRRPAALRLAGPRRDTLDPPRVPEASVQVSRVGLMMPPTLSYDDWAQAGQRLSGIVDSSAWCLGDWLVYGKRHYADRYQRAIRAAGLQYQTLRNYAWVARRFDLDRRRAALSFQHHAEVASMPEDEQTRWLDAAEEHVWTTKQLRRQIQARQVGDAPVPDQNALIPRIQVIDSRLRRWRVAAEQVGADFDHWVVSALDVAAEQVLSSRLPVVSG